MTASRHGTQIVLWKTGHKKETDPETGEKVDRQVLLARMLTVFNAEQGEQLPDRFYPAKTGEPVDEIASPSSCWMATWPTAGWTSATCRSLSAQRPTPD
jgi:antirestriction protein ArdC